MAGAPPPPLAPALPSPALPPPALPTLVVPPFPAAPPGAVVPAAPPAPVPPTCVLASPDSAEHAAAAMLVVMAIPRKKLGSRDGRISNETLSRTRAGTPYALELPGVL